MQQLVLMSRSGIPIARWEDWPRREKQWKPGRSAMEIARAWFVSGSPQCPPELALLLGTQPALTDIVFDAGRAEHITALPHGRGGTNHDLALNGHTPDHQAVVCIEAKADEPFGEKIGHYWRRMTESKETTLAPKRIEALLKTVFGDGASLSDSRYCDLRYQLLTGVVGTLRQAEKDRAPLAVFVVHEFHTGSVRPRALATNSADYARFIEALFSVPAGDVVEGVLYGPQVALTGINATQVVLFIGKVAYEGSRSCG